MGCGYCCRCDNCGYSFDGNLGVGFLYPLVYADTVEAMKQGKLGAAGKHFFENHPDGAINCEKVVGKCVNCKEYGIIPDLTMYVPKRGHEKFRQDYYMKSDLRAHFKEWEKYKHTCPTCGGTIELVEDFEVLLKKGKLPCIKCGGTLKSEENIYWD